jgi:hypothetical protein
MHFFVFRLNISWKLTIKNKNLIVRYSMIFYEINCNLWHRLRGKYLYIDNSSNSFTPNSFAKKIGQTIILENNFQSTNKRISFH